MPVCPSLRSLTATLTALLVATTGALALVTPEASAATRATPGDFTGYAFDTCDAPSQRAMNRVAPRSKYAGIGIYVAGMNRACSSQPNLTRRWVRAQSSRRAGGCCRWWSAARPPARRRATTAASGSRPTRRATTPGRRAQGTAAARSRRAGRRARLGIGRGSVLWFDLEHFDLGNRRCRASAMAFTSAWTAPAAPAEATAPASTPAPPRASGWSTPRGRRRSRKLDGPGLHLDGRVEPRGHPALGVHLARRGWWPHRRVHQYRGGHIERHGGVALAVDSNVLRTGRGTRRRASPGRAAAYGVELRATTPAPSAATAGARSSAAQCLLKQRKRLRRDAERPVRHGHRRRRSRRFQRDAGAPRSPARPDPRDLDRAAGAGARRQPLVKVGTRRQRRTTGAARAQRRRPGRAWGRRGLRPVRRSSGRAVKRATSASAGRPRTASSGPPGWRGAGLQAPRRGCRLAGPSPDMVVTSASR